MRKPLLFALAVVLALAFAAHADISGPSVAVTNAGALRPAANGIDGVDLSDGGLLTADTSGGNVSVTAGGGGAGTPNQAAADGGNITLNAGAAGTPDAGGSGTAGSIRFDVASTEIARITSAGETLASPATLTLAGLTGHGALTLTSGSGVQSIAPGTSGNVLTSDGTDWKSSAASGGGGEYQWTVYEPGNITSGGLFAQTSVTNASTVAAGSVLVIGQSGSDGPGGPHASAFLLCADGATCSGSNKLVTCTITPCNTATSSVISCTRNNAAISAAATLSWSTSSTCLVDPAGNISTHITVP